MSSSRADQAALLSEESVAGYLVQRGVLPPDSDPVVRSLGGGVSNIVLAVDGRYVVKQSLPQLRVESEWLAKRERAITEARALTYAHRISPDAVPAVLDVDEERCALTIAAAPSAWRCWKDDLLDGHADADVGARLGSLLGRWHFASSVDEGLAAAFGDHEAFDQLRVDPYFRTLAERQPDHASAVHAVVEAMLARRVALVHGDFSPKNVMVGPHPDQVWVIDFEVAHHGDPAFDQAFLLTHLLLKSIHVPVAREHYRAVATAFLAAYDAVAPAGLTGPVGHVWALTGALLLARVHGKSPAEYLTEAGREAATRAGAMLLHHPPAAVDDAWQALR